MILKFLGRGSAFNVQEGNTSAFYKDEGKLLLIDCGESIFKRIIETGLLDDVTEVSILITHLHSDHVGSLSSLLYYLYYVKHIVADIYFPSGGLHTLLLTQGNCTGEDYNLCATSLHEECNIFNSISIKPIETNHSVALRSYGYLISFNIEEKNIWYSGDTNTIPDRIHLGLVDEIYQDTCILNYENNPHMSLDKLCKIVKDSCIREKIYCMHLDSYELEEKARVLGFNVVNII